VARRPTSVWTFLSISIIEGAADTDCQSSGAFKPRFHGAEIPPVMNGVLATAPSRRDRMDNGAAIPLAKLAPIGFVTVRARSGSTSECAGTPLAMAALNERMDFELQA